MSLVIVCLFLLGFFCYFLLFIFVVDTNGVLWVFSEPRRSNSTHSPADALIDGQLRIE